MASANILVVEDDSIVAKDIKVSLEKLGFTLAGIACTGEDAVKLAELNNPDAILMDISLKGDMDGIEAAKRINELFSIPIIYLTANQDKRTIDKSKETKPYGYLLKPLNERDLNACLRMALYRFETEKKLRESEERYFRLTENARDMIFRISIVNGIYEYVNKASFDLTGYTPQEFYSTPMLIEKIIHPDWRNYFRVLWEEIKEGSVPEIFEYQIITKAGETRWLNQRNVVIKNDSDIPAALEGIVTDVTDRKKTEALLRKQSEEYRLILDSMPAMVLVKNYDNRLMKVNKLAAVKKGVKIEEMEGKFSEEFYNDDSGETLKMEREIMISGIPRLNSVEIYTNGTPEKKWAKVDRFPYRNEKGEITGVIVFSQDITDQKNAEDELKKIEAKNTAILNALPDLIFKTDSEGTVLEYKANEAELNIAPADFMGKKVHDFLPPHLADEAMLNIKKTLETGKIQIYEYKREAGDKNIEYEIRYIKSGDNEVIALVRDITERKQFEVKLRESEARYRNLTDNAPVCLTRLLVKERIYEFANAEFVKQSGFTLEEFNSLTDEQLNDLIHPDDRDSVLKEYSAWAKEGCPGIKHISYRFSNKGGRLIWLDTYHYADYDTAGKIYAVNQIYIDVTEQKKSEYALKLSEEKFRSLADTTHAVMFIYQDDKFVYGNSNAEILTGYSLNELYKMNFWDIIHPAFREASKMRGIARQNGEDVPSRSELKIIGKNGNEKWIDFSGSMFEFNGRPAVLGTAIDITDRKKTDEILKDSEEKYRNLSQNAPVAVTRLSVDNYKYEFVNDEFIRQSGYTMDEINALPNNILSELIHDDDRQRVLSEYNNWLTNGCKGVNFIEYKVINRNNVLLWLNSYLYAEFDSAGKPKIINQICIDVTDRKISAELVKQSEEKFRAVAESMPAQIVIFQGEKFVYANPYTEKLTGYTVEEALKMNFWDLVHPDSREDVKAIELARQKGKPVPEGYEIKIVTKNHKEKWLYYSAKLISYNNNIAVLGTIIDITERKKAEESLKGSLIEKEILLKEIHHRVKNNLQIVSSLLKLQSKYIKDENSLELFKESQNRVQSMALIHQKLYQAKDLTNINFCEYAGNLISYLMQTFGITTELIEVIIQPERIYMSIDNAIPAGLIINELVTNAIKHGFPDNAPGKIEIDVSFNETTENYSIAVHDNGVGISEEIDINNSPSFGLKLVTTLAEQMKGKVEVTKDNGTTFTVTMKNAHYKERS